MTYRVYSLLRSKKIFLGCADDVPEAKVVAQGWFDKSPVTMTCVAEPLDESAERVYIYRDGVRMSRGGKSCRV